MSKEEKVFVVMLSLLNNRKVDAIAAQLLWKQLQEENPGTSVYMRHESELETPASIALIGLVKDFKFVETSVGNSLAFYYQKDIACA